MTEAAEFFKEVRGIKMTRVSEDTDIDYDKLHRIMKGVAVKVTPSEVARLNAWVQNFAIEVQNAAEKLQK